MWPNSLERVWRVELDPLTALVTAGMAVALYLVAKWQLGAIYRTSRDQLDALNKTSRAGLLIQIEKMWSSPSIKEGLEEIWTLIGEAEQAAALAEQAGPQVRTQVVIAECGRRITGKMKTEPKTYAKMLEVCGFFETVGYAANQGYVTLSDICELYGPVVLRVWEVFQAHIDDQRPVLGSPEDGGKGLFKYFLWLSDECRRRLRA